MRSAREKTGKKCVVLVDEYDKPLLDVLGNDPLEEHNKAVFKGFFGTLKSYDEYLRFVFITGVTKFSKVSIFSDMNQLQDISMFEEYSGICGMTEAEIRDNFQPELQSVAARQQISEEKCLQELGRMYDGYHFFPGCPGIYNPFSVLNALSKRELSNFWFSTGTPTFLVPLLYQTGYLTITGYDREEQLYILGFPNEEVKYGFLKSLFPEYVPTAVTGSGKDVVTLRRRVRAGDVEGMLDVLTALSV